MGKSIYSMSMGKHDKFMQTLDNNGFDADLMNLIIDRVELTKSWIAWLREHAVSDLTVYTGMFVSPEEQLNNVRIWNVQRNWGFSEADFPTEIPDFVPSHPLETLVLCVYLPDKGRGKNKAGFVRTANELWELARNRQLGSWQLDVLRFDAEGLRLLPGTEARHTPGLRWMVVCIGANWNMQSGLRPMDIRNETSAHAEILAAAAHFPRWIQAMNGTIVPYVWLAGYQSAESDDEMWEHVPVLGFNQADREVKLSTGWDDRSRSGEHALPVARELL